MSDQGMLPGFEDLVVEDEHISVEEARRVSGAALVSFEGALERRPAAAPLREGFEQLRVRGWDWRKALYIAWARLPGKGRWPGTHEELAEVMGLRSARVIRKWRARNPEIERLIREAMVGRVMERTADILEAAVGVALAEGYKGFKDRQMLLEMGGIYRREQAVALTTAVVNADDMARARRETEEWERERFGGLGEGFDRAVAATLRASEAEEESVGEGSVGVWGDGGVEEEDAA